MPRASAVVDWTEFLKVRYVTSPKARTRNIEAGMPIRRVNRVLSGPLRKLANTVARED
jgi:hypothetical protein